MDILFVVEIFFLLPEYWFSYDFVSNIPVLHVPHFLSTDNHHCILHSLLLDIEKEKKKRDNKKPVLTGSNIFSVVF